MPCGLRLALPACRASPLAPPKDAVPDPACVPVRLFSTCRANQRDRDRMQFVIPLDIETWEEWKKVRRRRHPRTKHSRERAAKACSACRACAASSLTDARRCFFRSPALPQLFEEDAPPMMKHRKEWHAGAAAQMAQRRREQQREQQAEAAEEEEDEAAEEEQPRSRGKKQRRAAAAEEEDEDEEDEEEQPRPRSKRQQRQQRQAAAPGSLTVEEVGPVGAAHAADDDHLLDARGLGGVDLRLLPLPVNLLRHLVLLHAQRGSRRSRGSLAEGVGQGS